MQLPTPPAAGPLAATDDAILAARFLAGDVAAAEELYRRTATPVFQLVFRLLRDRDAAQDVLQQSYIRAFERLGEFRGGNFAAWIRRIAATVALNAMRHRRTRMRYETAWAGERSPATPPPGAGIGDRVQRAIDALPQSQRAVFVLFDVEGYSHDEIGQMMGISAGACRVRLTRARERLRELLGDLMEE